MSTNARNSMAAIRKTICLCIAVMLAVLPLPAKSLAFAQSPGTTDDTQGIESESYTVRYDGNGATGGRAPDGVSCAYDAAVVVQDQLASSDPLKKQYYDFTGWNTKPDGSGTGYLPGDTVRVKEDTTLYAQWKANSYSVMFDTGGGTGAPDYVRKQYGASWGSSPALPGPPAMEGCKFIGWYTAPGGMGKQVTKQSVMDTPADFTLYAAWEIRTVHVFLHKWEGHDAAYDIWKQWGSTYGMDRDATMGQPLPTPEWKGHRFLGWYAGPEEQYRKVTDNTEVTTGADRQDLYARWAPETYMVNFDPNGGSVDPQSQIKVYATTYGGVLNGEKNEPLPKPVKAGFDFGGWYMGANGTGGIVKNETVVDAAADHTLHAKWIPLPRSSAEPPAGKASQAVTIVAHDGESAMPGASAGTNGEETQTAVSAMEGSGALPQGASPAVSAVTAAGDKSSVLPWTLAGLLAVVAIAEFVVILRLRRKRHRIWMRKRYRTWI